MAAQAKAMVHTAPPDFLHELLRRYGSHSLAFSIIQPGMHYFGAPYRGVIAFRRRFGQVTVLGDPLCDPLETSAFLNAFLAACPNAFFMQVHRQTADCLRPFGYRATPVGVENEIDTCDYKLYGKRKRDLRHYRNKARHAGITVREEPDTQETRDRLQPVSDAWLPLKSWFAHEIEFLARPFQPVPEPGARIFVGYLEDKPVGFVILDPIFADGKAQGYSVSILRHYPDAPEGACDYINLCAIDQLYDEGIPLFSLGVSPFYRMEELAAHEGRGAWPVYLTFRALDRWGSPIYHFRGLSFHKSRYRAREVPVYACVRGRLGLLPLYASARACRML
jgi:lysylphosphatidylglycerol synthetase-like protein (DUF2156 family)